MEEIQSIPTNASEDFSNSLSSRLIGLVDIPLSTRIRENLSALFNFLDIYGPKIPLLHSVVTYIRFFQIIGGAFMASNGDVFDQSTFTFRVISIITVLFHVIPVEYRWGNEYLFLYVINAILLIFGIYLLICSFIYKKTSTISKFSIVTLTLFMSFVPFILIPISVQYAGQIISAYIRGVFKIEMSTLFAVILTAICTFCYTWTMIKCYSRTLTFRATSFQTVESGPQCKIFITTNVVTFISSLTTYLTQWPSLACIILSIACFIYNSFTVFGCGTFVKLQHQTLVLASSIIGACISGASIIPIVTGRRWGPYFFIGVLVISVISLILSEMFIKRRVTKDLHSLDEFEATGDFEVIGKKNKFKQVVATGFTYAHKTCIDFTVFKAAVQKWNNDLDVWIIYAKFASIYPELSHTLEFIGSNMKLIAKKNQEAQYYMMNIGQIIKTRETKFTPELKSKISKITKHFDKSKNRLRNIWDLVLQGNVNEIDTAIRAAYDSVNTSEVEMNQLLMLYPNNRFVARQYARLQIEIKSDPCNFKKWNDNLKQLQKGVMIYPDTLHELGFIAYENIPEYSNESATGSKVGTEQESIVDDFSTTFEDDLDLQKVESIKNMIDRHKIPAIQYMYYSTALSFIFLIFIPFMTLLGLFFIFSSNITKPLELMYGISYMRNMINMLPAFLSKFLMQEIEDPNEPGTKLMTLINLPADFPMDAYGNTRGTKRILEYLITQVSSANTMIVPLRHFASGNKHIEKVRDLMFAGTLDFNFVINTSKVITTKSNLVQVSYMIANHISKVIGLNNYTADVPKNLDTLTAKNNNVDATEALTKSIEYIVSFMKDIDARYQKIIYYARMPVIGLVIITYIIIYNVQIRKLRSNKIAIYGLLSSLPKTVISNISYSYSKLQREPTATIQSLGSVAEIETNRQEESIIKLFSSINDGSARAKVELNNLFNILFIIAAACVAYYFICESFINSSVEVVRNCYHINYMYGSIAHIFSVFSNIFSIVLQEYHPLFENTCINETDAKNEIKKSLPIIGHYFQLLRLGGNSNDEFPFSAMNQAVAEASITIKCTDPYMPPTIIPESSRCFSAGGQFYLSNALLSKFSNLMFLDDPVYPLPKGDGLTYAWQIGAIELYEAFFYRAGLKLVPTIKERVKAQVIPLAEFCFIFMIIALVFSLNILRLTRAEEVLLKFTMNCLLKVHASTLMSNSRIMEILSGNYANAVDETTEKTQKFHNDVVNKISDIIIVCREENSTVISVNTAFEEMFGIKQEDMENKNIKEFFLDGKFTSKEKLERVIISKGQLIYTKPNQEKVYFEFLSQNITGRRIYSLINQTQNVMHEKLIEEEKKKSDAMLASILPPMLVPRVQAGEKNISFAVQSATVLFLDVVEFTPWCGSHDAQYVMRMLNIMFKEFDSITAAHKTMTKIKCIGDCYMAAGGIFDEVNQPAIHAKEVVDFGCKAIKKLEEIDERENEKLRIRVGINTGGPIVAGVIGTEKPTFEILGPAINIAHEMENKGVPMKVHISRPVYELIYGQQFDIKERGEIDIKGGKLSTYLVEP